MRAGFIVGEFENGEAYVLRTSSTQRTGTGTSASRGAQAEGGCQLMLAFPFLVALFWLKPFES